MDTEKNVDFGGFSSWLLGACCFWVTSWLRVYCGEKLHAAQNKKDREGFSNTFHYFLLLKNLPTLKKSSSE